MSGDYEGPPSLENQNGHMKTDYVPSRGNPRPSKREVIGEMGKNLAEGFTLKDAGLFIEGATVGPYIYPSFIRKIGKLEGSNYVSSLVGLSIGLLIQAPLYFDHAFYNPKVLIIPAATNIASGLYEWYRHTRNKMVEKRKDLESEATSSD